MTAEWSQCFYQPPPATSPNAYCESAGYTLWTVLYYVYRYSLTFPLKAVETHFWVLHLEYLFVLKCMKYHDGAYQTARGVCPLNECL